MGDTQHESVSVTTRLIHGDGPDDLSGKIRLSEERDVPDEPDLTGRRMWTDEEIETVQDTGPCKSLNILFVPADTDSSYEWDVKISFRIYEYYVSSADEHIHRRTIAEMINITDPVGFDEIGASVADYISEQINTAMGSHESRRAKIEEQLDNTDEIVAAFTEHPTDELIDVFGTSE